MVVFFKIDYKKEEVNIIKKFEKIANNIDVVVLILLLIVIILSMRNSELLNNIEIAVNIIMISYVIIRMKKKKAIRIVQSRLDIFIILLIISTTIPLIFNTYISLTTTMNTILNYITMFWIYLLIREIIKKNKNDMRYIKNIIIFISILLILVGIENLTTNKIFQILSIEDVANGESRLISFFDNPNVFASFIMFSLFISINEMIMTQKNGKQMIYGICNFIMILGILLTYSKLVFLIIPLFLIIYMIKIKERNSILYVILNIIMAFILSLVYIYLFQAFLNQKYYISIFVLTILWVELAFVCNMYLIKINRVLEKNVLLIIIGIIVTVILIGIWTYIGMQEKTDFIISKENTTSYYRAKKIKNIKPNQKYIFSFDIDAKILNNNKEMEEIFCIRIIQRDDKSIDEIISQVYTFGEFVGKKEMEIYTTANTSEIKIEFTIKDKTVSTEWIIKDLKLNDKEIILEYKFLPTKLIEKIGDISLQYKTAQERFQFTKDGLKLIFKNYLTGIGGEGWKLKYKEIQEYGYTANDIHNYYVQIWLEFGVLGLISIIGVLWSIIGIRWENKLQRNSYIGIQLGILAILLHTAMDCDMYYLYMKMFLFMGLGILATIEEKGKKRQTSYIANIILLIVGIGAIVLFCKPEIYQKELTIDRLEKYNLRIEKESEEYQENNKKILQSCEKIIKYERDISTRDFYKVKKVKYAILQKGVNLKEIISAYYAEVLSYKNLWKYDEEKIVQKSGYITNINKVLEEYDDPELYIWMVKLAKINIDEYESTKQLLAEAITKKHKRINESAEYKKLLQNYEESQRIYNKYSLEENKS